MVQPEGRIIFPVLAILACTRFFFTSLNLKLSTSVNRELILPFFLYIPFRRFSFLRKILASCGGDVLNLNMAGDITLWSISSGEVLYIITGWKKACEINQHHEHLCEVYLLRARISLASFQLGEVENQLELCQKTAEESDLIIYYSNAVKERNIFSEHKKRIQLFLEIETTLAPEEQEKKLKEYVKAALLSLET